MSSDWMSDCYRVHYTRDHWRTDFADRTMDRLLAVDSAEPQRHVWSDLPRRNSPDYDEEAIAERQRRENMERLSEILKHHGL